MTCDRCGVTLEIGMYPFCRGEASAHAPGLLRVKLDTLLGGFLAENAWREPRYFDSQKAYERALDSDGLMLRPKRVAGDNTIDPQTLENARVLVSRNAKPLDSFSLATRVLDDTVSVPMEQGA